MPVIQRETIVAANSVDENVIANSAFEFLRQDAIISIGCVGSATGLVANIQSGSDVVLEESPLAVLTRMPVIPDDMYYNDVGVAMDRLTVRVRNTTGAPLTARTVVQITNL